MTRNQRETGAREPVEDHRPTDTSQNAAMPDKPKPYGLTEPEDGTDDKAAKSGAKDAHGADKPSPAPQKVTGAGPAIAEHSKDAASPKPGGTKSANEKP